MLNVTKIHPEGAELIHMDRWMAGQTKRHEKSKRCFSRVCECT